MIRTNRGLLKYIILTLVTFGIYGIVCMCNCGRDVNIIASPYDNRKTMNWFLCVLLSMISLGIPMFVWFHRYSNRIGNELRRRGISYQFNASTFWLWYILGSMLCGIGQFVYMHKMFKALNMLGTDYNSQGY